MSFREFLWSQLVPMLQDLLTLQGFDILAVNPTNHDSPFTYSDINKLTGRTPDIVAMRQCFFKSDVTLSLMCLFLFVQVSNH